MSDRRVAKNRWHRGLSNELRLALRRVGISLDEEAAQFALSGMPEVEGIAVPIIDDLIADIINRRDELTEQWVKDNPKKNPYPPSFPERMLLVVREAQKFAYEAEELSMLAYLNKLQVLCENELNTEPTTEDHNVSVIPRKED